MCKKSIELTLKSYGRILTNRYKGKTIKFVDQEDDKEQKIIKVIIDAVENVDVGGYDMVVWFETKKDFIHHEDVSEIKD